MGFYKGQPGDLVKISKSSDLTSIGLSELAGRSGIVEEANIGDEVRRDNRGYYVKLAGGPFQGEKSWFIPRVSVSPIKTAIENRIQGEKMEFVYNEGSGAASYGSRDKWEEGATLNK